jgi:uncharacterized membrane protein YfcA
MDAAQTLLFLACVALATAAQTLTGFAFALILLGVSSLFGLASVADAANVATLLSLFNAVVALRTARSSMDLRATGDMVLGSVPGIAVGVILLAWLSANVVAVLKLLLGVTVVVCAVVVLFEAAVRKQRSARRVFVGWGVVSGILSGLFGTGGPPLVYHLYRQPMAVKAVRDTLVAALAVNSLVRLAMVIPAGQFSANALRLSLLAAPLVFGLSWWLERHPPRWSRTAVLRLVCALLTLTGVALVGPAVTQLTGWQGGTR